MTYSSSNLKIFVRACFKSRSYSDLLTKPDQPGFLLLIKISTSFRIQYMSLLFSLCQCNFLSKVKEQKSYIIAHQNGGLSDNPLKNFFLCITKA